MFELTEWPRHWMGNLRIESKASSSTRFFLRNLKKKNFSIFNHFSMESFVSFLVNSWTFWARKKDFFVIFVSEKLWYAEMIRLDRCMVNIRNVTEPFCTNSFSSFVDETNWSKCLICVERKWVHFWFSFSSFILRKAFTELLWSWKLSTPSEHFLP